MERETDIIRKIDITEEAIRSGIAAAAMNVTREVHDVIESDPVLKVEPFPIDPVVDDSQYFLAEELIPGMEHRIINFIVTVRLPDRQEPTRVLNLLLGTPETGIEKSRSPFSESQVRLLRDKYEELLQQEESF